jgi:hypothetical protein
MKNIIILFFSFVLSGYSYNMFAQTKNIPSPDKEIAFDKAPVVIKRAPVVYPPLMLDKGWEAMVYVKAFITTEGIVGDARIEKIEIKAEKIVINTNESDNSDQEKQTDGKTFEEAALASVNEWKFTPAQMQGKPVAVWITVPFKFKLSKDKKKITDKESEDAETEKMSEVIKTNIENILKGEDIEKAKSCIDKNALLVYKNRTVNLQSVLNGKHKDVILTEGKESHCVNINMKISEGGSSAVVVWKSRPLKGKNERTHSIVLTKTPSKGWKITHWHVSF